MVTLAAQPPGEGGKLKGQAMKRTQLLRAYNAAAEARNRAEIADEFAHYDNSTGGAERRKATGAALLAACDAYAEMADAVNAADIGLHIIA